MANKPLSFVINADAVARALSSEVAEIKKDLQRSVQGLAASTHAKVLELANQDLEGYHLKTFIGENNVRWQKAGENLWVVEIDESVMMYNDGIGPRSMLTTDWLLKNAKVSKKGDLYKVIPFRTNLKSEPKPSLNPTSTSNVLMTMTRNAIRQAKTPQGKRIPLKTIEKNPDGTPKLGILHKIPLQPPFSQKEAPSLFSKPRSPEMAKQTGLKAHEGIYKLAGMAVSQRMVGNKVKREAVTFRVASSKQRAEGRWMYPAIDGKQFLKRAFDWAIGVAWPNVLKELETKMQARNSNK